MRNKDKKRIRICMLMSLLLLCTVPCMTANAAAAPTLSASTDSSGAVNGQAVDIKINLGNNPGISTLGMVLNYDTSILQYSSSTWNGSFSGSDMTLASDNGGALNLSVVCDDIYTASGVVVTVRFQVIGDSSAIPVTLGLRDMSDSNLAAVTNCKVTSALIMPQAKDTQPAGNTTPAVSTTAPDTSNRQTVSTNTVSTSRTTTQSTASRSSSKPDENYKTGAGFGNDVYLFAAAFCGILALAVIYKKEVRRTN